MAESTSSPGSRPVAGPQMLEALLNEAVGAIITIDEQGIMLNVNPAAERLFGYAVSELIGNNVKMLMPEPHRGEHDGYLDNHVRTGVKKIIGIGRNVEGMRKDGSLFPMHLAVSSFYVEGTRYFSGIIHDLSEQERIQSEHSRQSSIFEAVFNNVPNALIITDHERNITLCNRAVEETFGHRVEDLVGQHIHCLHVSREESDQIGELIASLPTGAPIEPLRADYLREDGTVFPGQFVGAHIVDTTGKSIGFLSLIWDITQDLEQRKALSAAQRMDAFGQLTGGIAHDFNNLLTVIMGNHELLEMVLSGEREITLLKRAQDAAEMGARLTNRLLTFARRRQLEPNLINLNEQVLGMADLLRRTLGSDLTFSTKLSPRLPNIKADPSEVENAILNLSINARDAMEGNGRLVIETAVIETDREMEGGEGWLVPGKYVRLSVSDTGAGMDKDVLSRAFEPFFTTKEQGKGTGLGLSTVYGFARQTGGTATIYSELGNGTTINLYFPAFEESPKSLAESDDATHVVPTSRGEMILVVEDNDDVRAVTEQRLAKLGYRVLAAASGPEAVQLLEANREVELVFSDVVMPGGMTGLDVAQWVREHRPSTKVLLTSGFAEDVIGANEELAPGLEVLRKPYSQQSLANALRRALDG